MASIKLKGDTSGEVTISAPSVAGTTTLELPATSSTLATQNSLGVRNLIINGDMRIAQRGTSFAISTGAMEYGLDRWAGRTTPSTGLFTVSQSSDAPSGFQKSLLATVTTSYTPSGTSSSTVRQYIEGFNIAHLDWGTANAKTVTLSFWVKSSLTGTFGGAFRNESVTRSYPFTYTISSANTWEQKSITIVGDTTGTWATTTGSGIQVLFSLGTGTGHTNTAGSWVGEDNHGADGQVQLIQTSGATWQITGVQLEVGTEATPFEHRPYDMELARCQRYYHRIQSEAADQVLVGAGGYYTTTAGRAHCVFPTTMRAEPTVNYSSISDFQFLGISNLGISALSTFDESVHIMGFSFTSASSTSGSFAFLRLVNDVNAYIDFSAEL